MHQPRVFDGIAFAFLIFFFLTGRDVFVWVSAALLFLSLSNLPFVNKAAHVVESILRTIGTILARTALALVFVVFVIPYGALFQLFHRSFVNQFLGKTKQTSFYRLVSRAYDKSFFEKPW